MYLYCNKPMSWQFKRQAPKDCHVVFKMYLVINKELQSLHTCKKDNSILRLSAAISSYAISRIETKVYRKRILLENSPSLCFGTLKMTSQRQQSREMHK